MSKINDGGPAYPRATGLLDNWDSGMTVRQVYAKDAMKGMLANPAYTDTPQHAYIYTPQQKWIAEQAYKQADAMLAFEANESK